VTTTSINFPMRTYRSKSELRHTWRSLQSVTAALLPRLRPLLWAVSCYSFAAACPEMSHQSITARALGRKSVAERPRRIPSLVSFVPPWPPFGHC
jgi:hypothetical protein